MRAQHSGHIVNLSSIAGLAPVGGYSFYAAAKFAVEGLSTAVAHEVRDLGIKVTVVEPGAFRTDFLTDSSIRYTGESIDDYDESAGQVRTILENMNGNQPGDPQKAAQAILEAVNSDAPPMHLVLGQDAFNRVSSQTTAFNQELEKWKGLTLSTDFPQLVAN